MLLLFNGPIFRGLALMQSRLQHKHNISRKRDKHQDPQSLLIKVYLVEPRVNSSCKEQQ